MKNKKWKSGTEQRMVGEEWGKRINRKRKRRMNYEERKRGEEEEGRVD